MEYVQFNLEGFIKPQVRTTKAQMHVDPQYKEYLESRREAQLQIKTDMSRRGLSMFPEQKPLWAFMLFHVERVHTNDLDNKMKTVLDAMKGIVYPEDRWVDWKWGFRVHSPANTIDRTSVLVGDWNGDVLPKPVSTFLRTMAQRECFE